MSDAQVRETLRKAATTPHLIDMGEIDEAWQGQWIAVKPWITHANLERLQAAGAATSGDAESQADAVLIRIVLLAQLQVVDWRLLDRYGDRIDRTREGIEAETVPADLLEQATIAIDGYYAADIPAGFSQDRKRRLDNLLAPKVKQDGASMPFLPEDSDLAIALKFGADPFDVNYVWPVKLRQRALTWMNAEAELESKRAKRRNRKENGRSRRNRRRRR